MHDTQRGFSYIDAVLDSINTYNRCFEKLMDMREHKAALPLIRLQIDNLVYLYAEAQNPGVVLQKIYKNGRKLDKIKIDGTPLSYSSLIDALDESHNGIKELYKTYCFFIHPSKIQNEFSLRVKDPARESTIQWLKEQGLYDKVIVPEDNGIYDYESQAVRELKRDMVKVNQTVADVLLGLITTIEARLKAIGKKKDYLEYVRGNEQI